MTYEIKTTKVQWCIQTTVVFVLRFVWISIWLLSYLILLEILRIVYLKYIQICPYHLINQSVIYYALIWSFSNVDLRSYKRESIAILYIFCFAHWIGPNYFFHTWHLKFWKPFQCKVFLCTRRHRCCLKCFIVNAQHKYCK